MKIFAFDTETTWFINKKENDLDKQPRIIQFAWILWNLENGVFEEEERVNILINPKTNIPFWSSEIHHIYDVDVKDAPYIEEVIDDIMKYINWPDIIIWHNIEYDEDMIKLELKRLQKEFQYRPKQIVCTMNETINFCKLAKKNEASKWFKRPKLWELYKKLFWEYFTWAHDAIVDVEATLKCFVELVNNWIIKVKQKQDNIMTLF